MAAGFTWNPCEDHASDGLKQDTEVTVPGLKILIVEDQILIAKQVEVIALAAGHRVVGISGTLAEACRLAMASEPDVALVDLSLNDGVTGTAVGKFVKEACKTEVVYMTANMRRLPPDLEGALGVVEKPFTRGDLVSALGFIDAVVRNGQVPDKVPRSIRLAPSRKEVS